MDKTRPLTLPAPAKINLFLHVRNRRKDGYHNIETVFQFLELSDTLQFELTDHPGVHRVDRHNYSLPEEDLVVRAIQLIKATCCPAKETGVKITLHKTIPPGSGLGGGSSNAATALVAMNRLWKLGRTREQLIEFGRQLGADVPVFLFGKACWATGVGDTMVSFSPPEHWVCVAIPDTAVSTQAVFAHLSPVHAAPTSKADFYTGKTTNHLQAVTGELYPQIADALALLSRFGEARMSGSGSAIFIPCTSRQQALSIRTQLPPHIKGWVCRAVNQHPLFDDH